MMESKTRRDGFTLIELMIVVAIIGIITTIAIPSFMQFQLRAKRAEANVNLEAIAKGEKSYASEYNVYASTLGTWPGPAPGVSKRTWDAPSKAAFALLSWVPEGAVYFDYGVQVDNCPALDCFTAEAYGDLDGDGLLSVLSYVQPSRALVWASEPLPGFAPLFPPIDSSGNNIFSQVALSTPNNVY